MIFDDPLKPYETPKKWTPDHVIRRMVWAFEDLSRVKMRVGPAGYGSGWPAYVHEWEDLLAQEEPTKDETKSQAEHRRIGERKPIKLPPSKHQLSLMDEALWWPVKYLAEYEAHHVQIARWAYSKARSANAEDKVPSIGAVFIEATIISTGLTKDFVPVR